MRFRTTALTVASVRWTGRAQEDQHLDFKLLDKPDMGKDDLRMMGIRAPSIRRRTSGSRR